VTLPLQEEEQRERHFSLQLIPVVRRLVDASSLKTGTIEATVKFALSAEAMKGRAGFRSGIRPNHWLQDREYTFVGQLDFIDRDWLRPGEECAATVTLLIAEQDRDRFVPGFSWQVGESVRIVGECTLLSIERPYEPIEAKQSGPPDLASWLDSEGGISLRSGSRLTKGWS
jgi:hypothetical protein